MLQNPFVPTEGQMAYILEISKSKNKLNTGSWSNKKHLHDQAKSKNGQ